MESAEEPIIIDWKTLILDYYLRPFASALKTEVLELAHEAFDTYKAKCYRAAIVFSAETVCRINFDLILNFVSSTDDVVEFKGRKNKKITLSLNDVVLTYRSSAMLHDELTFCKSIYLLLDLELIDEQIYYDMHALNNLRNRAVHGSLPSLEIYNDPRLDLPPTEIIKIGFGDRNFPIKYYNRRFEIEIFKEKQDYIVDQERLGIDFRKIKSELPNSSPTWGLEYAVISLGLMQTCVKNLSTKFPPLNQTSPSSGHS